MSYLPAARKNTTHHDLLLLFHSDLRQVMRLAVTTPLPSARQDERWQERIRVLACALARLHQVGVRLLSPSGAWAMSCYVRHEFCLLWDDLFGPHIPWPAPLAAWIEPQAFKCAFDEKVQRAI